MTSSATLAPPRVTRAARPAASARTQVVPTGVARPFADDEIIVSKTDLTGRITYANDVFLRVSGYARHEIAHAPHSVIRHPAMPRVVFQLLWDTIGAGREIFAYVLNLASDGDHYWVFAHVTPTLDARGSVRGYHSNRRTAKREAVAAVEPIYARLRAAEQAVEAGGGTKRDAIAASSALLHQFLDERGLSYDEYVWSL